ncbi:DUF397 domain-containing protein [Actinokineospora sp. UTMC 2448]|uniref:DUF397 domain-containing protein n=1 Tax=Actinokineospora sp. UTMC 2448 TaxID=2268449 RepID=UPI00216499FA|nr:DUF397 domain-containing protein [Actinokineospora sp. UTMC 2448]UVS82567.1 hypothetical protein Actkin_06340 [Actinokineospora sp. UTMC 2448]
MSAGSDWRISSFSGGSNACVELARTAEAAAVRDSKHRDGGLLRFSPYAFDALLVRVKK